MKGQIVLSLDHLRTLFTASFIALAIAACSGSGSEATSPSNQQPSNNNDDTSNSIELLSFVFLEKEENPVHGDYYPIDGQPTDRIMKANANLSGSIGDIEIIAIESIRGDELSKFSVENISDYSGISTYFGGLELPSVPFKIKAIGNTISGVPFSEIYDVAFTKQNIKVRFNDFPPLLLAGQEQEITFVVEHDGSPESFTIKIISSNEELFPSYEDTVTITGSHSVALTISIPENISATTDIRLNASAISTSNAERFNEMDASILVMTE